LRTLSAISFFPSAKFLKNYTGQYVQYLYAIKDIGHHACLREKEHLLPYRAYFERNLLRFVLAHAHVRAQMARIACAVGMCNAILRNNLKLENLLR